MQDLNILSMATIPVLPPKLRKCTCKIPREHLPNTITHSTLGAIPENMVILVRRRLLKNVVNHTTCWRPEFRFASLDHSVH